MTPWRSRPRDEANLFNPAFCGLLLFEAFKGYASTFEDGMPFPSSFLVLPLVLHKRTRELVPSRISASNGLANWTVDHPEVKLGFADRMRVLIPITRESSLFLLRAQD